MVIDESIQFDVDCRIEYLCMDFYRKYIHANSSFFDGEICVINYTPQISMNIDHEFVTTWIVPERLRQSKDQ